MISVTQKLIVTALFFVISVASTATAAPAISEPLPPPSLVLTEKERQIIRWVDDRRDQILQELGHHVEMNTGTLNRAGLDAYRALLEKELSLLGFDTSPVEAGAMPVLSCRGNEIQFADHLLATRHKGGERRIFLNGHMDTVFAKTDEFQTLTIDEDGTLHGPGVVDMKGGMVVLLNALRALESVGALEQAHLTTFLNSDEEMGSLDSREHIEKLAKEHDVGLIFEGTHKNQMVRARKGLGQVRVRVTGRESHAGAAHEEGVSANLELAHKIVAIEQLTDYKRQITVNTGVMSGGEKRNTIPGCAEAYVDLRYPDNSSGEALQESIREIAKTRYTASEKYPEFPKVEVWSRLHRPAKPEHPAVDQLISMSMLLSAEIGEPVEGTRFSGGGTDGSIAQAVGLPTLDTMGLDGAGAHSSREKTSIDSLIARTKLAAILLGRLVDGMPLDPELVKP